MEKTFEFVKSLVLNYKLDSCCCIVPVRVGVIITGYFNLTLAVICLIATANDSFPSTVVQVQTMILDDKANKFIPLLAYSTEIGFSFVLLCAIYRNDVVLLRVYMYYCIATIILSLLVYSIVIAAIDLLVQLAILFGTVFQVYVLLLVRSAIVEIKMSSKSHDFPVLVMSSLIQKEDQIKQDPDIEAAEKKDDAEEKEVDVEPETKLETIEETAKEGTYIPLNPPNSSSKSVK